MYNKKEPFMIQPITQVDKDGNPHMRLKVYNKNNPKIWMLFEPNKDNPEKLDLIKESK